MKFKTLLFIFLIIMTSGCMRQIETPPNPYTQRYGNYSNYTGAVYITGTNSSLSESNALFVVQSDTRAGNPPQFMVQDGGPYQASFITRSFMVVNQNNTLLLSNQSNDCRDWGFKHADCNTATTGADFGVTDDIEALGLIYSNQGLRSHSSEHGSYLVLGDRNKLYDGTNGYFDDTTNIFCDYVSNNFVDDGNSQWILIRDETNEYNEARGDVSVFINSSCIELEHNPSWNGDFGPVTWVVNYGVNMISQSGGFFEYYVGNDEQSKFKIKIKNGTVDGGGVYIDDTAGVRNHKALRVDQDMNGFSTIGQSIYMYSSEQLVDKQLSMLEMVGEASNMNSSDGVFIDMNIIGQPLTNDGELDGIHMPSGMSHLIKVGSADIVEAVNYEGTDIFTEATTPGATVEIFTNDNDVLYIGNDLNFTTIGIVLSSISSTTIAPLYYYCNSAGTWQPLTGVTTTTNGFKSSGVITFTNPTDRGVCNQELDGTPFTDITDYTYIAIQRTRNNIGSPPVLDLVTISGASENMYLKEDVMKLNPLNTAPDTCDTTNLGVIYFDTSEDDMCVCKSTGWKVISDGSDCT
jgi:hypothetical protein